MAEDYWTDPELITKDPEEPIYIRKQHLDELVQTTEEKEIENVKYIVSKNLKETDPDLSNLVHRAVEYCYGSPNWWYFRAQRIFSQAVGSETYISHWWKKIPLANMGQWLVDGELIDDPTTDQLEDADDVRMVSKIKDPDEREGPIMTSPNSTFITPNYVNFIREVIEWLRNYRTCQTMHTLLGKEREKFLCPVCGEYDIYPQELYCHTCRYKNTERFNFEKQDYGEDRGEWYKNGDDEWDIFTWTNPYLHTPLVMDLDRGYSKVADKIYFRDYQSLWKFVRQVVPEGETKEEQAPEVGEEELTPEECPLAKRKWSIPKDSYLFFNNHYRRYKVNLNRSIVEYEDARYGGDCLGDIDNPNFWMEISPSLEFDVKDGSEITLSQFKVKTKALKESATVEVDLSNIFLFDMDDWLTKSEYAYYTFIRRIGVGRDLKVPCYPYHSLLATLDKFLSPGTSVRFQGHDRVYTIKKADRNLTGTNPFSISIELTEELVKDVNVGEAVFLYTYLKAKHIEEIRTALDNLKMPPSFEQRPMQFGKADIENCETTYSGGWWSYTHKFPSWETQVRSCDFYSRCTDLEALRVYSNPDIESVPYFAKPHQCLIDEGLKGACRTRGSRQRFKILVGGNWVWGPWETRDEGPNSEAKRLQMVADGTSTIAQQMSFDGGWYALEYCWWNEWPITKYDAWNIHKDMIPLKGTRIKMTIGRQPE